jgi:thiol-disulfide isomerase/thioredoxin
LDIKALEQECLESIQNDDASSAIAERLESMFESEVPEAIRMLVGILRGEAMEPGKGWFGPAQKARDWTWIATQHAIDTDAAITKSDFQGDSVLFSRLDRNNDEMLQASDFDWSMASSYLREVGIANSVFRSIDKSMNAQVSKDEILAFFDKLRGAEDSISIDSFRRALPLGRSRGAYSPGDEPSKESLVRGFFASEIGSHWEGPDVGDKAIDFELSSQDQKHRARLQDQLGEKPVVLIFGNFTCGPFRRIYPEFDAIAQRYRDQANFMAIYVREAHPEDGWIMESNSRLGVRLPQPKSMEERRSVATTCAMKLNFSIPLFVDGMDDAVGNLYSGMPARAYVIDREGLVVYKSGRGPFGFIPGEMEQALVLTLLASSDSKDVSKTKSP